MPGPPPKHPSRRARRNSPVSASLLALPEQGRTAPAPVFPLGPDVERSARLAMLEDKMATLTADLEEAEDGRTKGRLRRQLDQAEMSRAVVKLEMEQARDAEVELWTLLWTTPQAVMWDQSAAFERLIAQFVRWNVRAEQGDLKAAVEARLRGAEFGLTPSSLLKLRREISETEQVEVRGQEQKERRQRRNEKSKGGAQAADPRGGLFDA